MPLTTFAFLHPLDPARLGFFRDALPEVEFLVAHGSALPAGVERAEGASLSWDSPPIDEVLAAAHRLRWLHQQGAGIDRIATPRLLASDLILTNGSGNHAANIAEHVLALMLAFARQLPALILNQQQRRWQQRAENEVFDLSGQTLAVIGFGAIGSALAERATGLGLRVIGVRRTPAGADESAPGVAALFGPDRLDAALAEADHAVIALPLTTETRGLIDAARLAALKRGAYLYNVGRGAVVDHAALLAALRSGQLAGAGLDVTDPEPLPADSPLWLEPGVLITAHSAGMTPRSFERHRALLLDNLRRFADGQALRNVVDKGLGY